MSITVTRAGILDTIQDNGRYGLMHLGINPGGAMDLYSAQLANIIAGNDRNDAVIEIHFPGSAYQFDEAAVIALTGADFTPTINEKVIELNKPVHVDKDSILRFVRPVTGARCYLAVTGGLDIQQWVGSYSTNLKAKTGGFKGRSIKKDDRIEFRNQHLHSRERMKNALGHAAYAGSFFALDYSSNEFHFIPGPEWDILADESKSILVHESFIIDHSSDRMGYRLSGPALKRKQQIEMVSSPVTFGTIQLLPEGQLIILMADHQTTGGYPRIGCIITSDHPVLAQKKPGDQIKFSENSGLPVAEELYLMQQKYLSRLEMEMKERIVEK